MKKRMSLFLKVALGILALLLPFHQMSAQGVSTAGLALVSATDFSAMGGDGVKSYHQTVDMIDGYTGVLKPSISIGGGFKATTTTTSTAKKSAFLDTAHYAVAYNPIRLDSLRMYDNGDSGEWGIVFSAGSKGITSPTTAMSYTVNGLRGNAKYVVEIEWSNPLADTYLDPSGNNKNPHLNSGYQSQIKVGTNNTQLNDGVNAGSPGTKAGSSNSLLIASPASPSGTQGPISGGSLTVNVVIQQMAAGEAIMIKSIKVYSLVDVKVSGVNQVCLGGETTVLSLEASYVNCKYQWYRDGKAISGATGQSYKHESALKAGGSADGSITYQYEMKVTASNGDVLSSDKFEVKDVLCCGTTDNPSSRKLIWQDDFGTFTSKGNYWVWDYSDINEPVKVQKKAADGWTYALDYEIPGAAYAAMIETEGQYSVAGNVTCKWDNQPGASGTQWEWQAQAMNGLKPAENGRPFVYDHTYDGAEYGAMLFVNCGNEPDAIIYERKIEGLCEKKVTVKCFIGNFSDSDWPVELYIRATDVSSGKSVESKTVKRYSSEKHGTPSGLGWQEISVDIELTTATPTLKFEIISKEGGVDHNKLGNDLILDDIQVYACAAPSVQLYFDDVTYDMDTVSCEGEDVSLFVEKTQMIENYYGSDARYLYQWTATPDDKKSWQPVVSSITDKIKVEDMSEIFSNFQPGDEIYFRVVLGTEDIFASNGGVSGYYNPDEACSSYTISDPIVALVSCPSCTEPAAPVISAKGGVVTKKRVDLCFGESTVLTSNDITGVDKDGKAYADYTIFWYKESVASSPLSSNKSAVTADPLTVAYADATEEGVQYILRIHDNFENTTGTKTCDKYDTILVVANPKPDKTLADPAAFCEGMLDAEPDKTIAGYDLYWYTAADTATATKEPVVKSALAAGSPTELYYVLQDSKTGCRGDANLYTITVHPIPTEALASIEPFCEGDKTVALPASASGYTVDWGTNSTDLASLEGKATPYEYQYTVTDSKTGCVSEPAGYTFTVNPIAKVTTEVAYECDATTVTATPSPSTATVAWTIDGTANAATGTSLTVDNVSLSEGSYVAVATAADYCESEPSTALDVKFYATPADLKGTSPEYLKADGAPDYTKISVSGTEAGLKVYWSAPAGPTKEDATASQAAPASGYSEQRADPSPNLASTDDEFFYYWIYQEREIEAGKTCKSTPTVVTVPVLGAPSPIVRDTVYCQNSDKAVAFLGANVEVNQAKPGVAYELVWKGGVDGSTVPDVSKPGVTTYEVAQCDAANKTNISAYRTFTVKVIGVDKPGVADNTLAYCANETASPVVAQKKDNNADNMYADAFVWAEDGTQKSSAPTPNTAVTATTTYNYSVYQTYTIPTSGELCLGEAVDFDVKVTYVPALTTSQVTYLKADANGGTTFSKNLVQQKSDVYEGADATATVNWYASDGTTCGTTALGGTPTPEIDPSVGVGKDQTVYYCVSQTVDGCEGEAEQVKVVISDAPAPKVEPVAYCEGETADPLMAEINELTNPASAYTLTWYDENHNKIGAAAPTPSTSMRAGETTVSEYKYYVTQTLTATGAESTESELKVTVYANPTLTITTQATVCETAVSLRSAVTLDNPVAGQSYTEGYYEDASGVTEIGASVEKSGTYYTKQYYTPAAGRTCVSEVKPITVTIDELEASSTDVTTCPDRSATFNVTVTTNVDASKVSYEWSEVGGTDNRTVSTSEFETRKFLNGAYGTVYPYHLKVTAGTCTEEGDYKVTLGEGPVVGKLTLTDSRNTELPVKEYDGVPSGVFHYCGGTVSVMAEYAKDADSEFVLEGPGVTTKGGGAFDIDAQSKGGAPVEYKLSYSNGCPTSTTFSVVNSAIEISNKVEKSEMCVGEPFRVDLDFMEKNMDYTVQWYKDDAAITGEAGDYYAIAETKAEDSGVYKAIVNSNGCQDTTETDPLKAKTYIKVTNQTEPYIVVRGESLEIPLTITEPQSGKVASVVWTAARSGAPALEGAVGAIASVEGDYKYDIVLTDPDHCSATTTAEVWVDARLQMVTDFKDTICYGEKHLFTIDTTGTGAFRREPAGVVTVTEKSGGRTADITSQFRPVNGKLVAELSPENDASYEVRFDYDAAGLVEGQHLDTADAVVVLQPIKIELPKAQTVCEGSEATIMLTSVAPVGTVITWDEDETIRETHTDPQTTAGEGITVKAKYDGGSSHQAEYVYRFTASYAGCQDTVMAVSLNVDEELEGEIESNAPICSGTNIKMDAVSYEAESYLWKKLDGTDEVSGPVAGMRLVKPTTFLLYMKRGTCDLETTYKAEVVENPTIERVDSAGIRARRIMATGGDGNYTYQVDNGGYDVLDTKNDLHFTEHTAYVMDGNGCSDTMPFFMTPPPVTVPVFFTPNGDGMNEQWIPTNLKEVYPDALVTIFDRYGKKLAQYRASDVDWDGTYNGVAMPSTDYWYEIDIEEIDKQYVGHFTLLRR